MEDTEKFDVSPRAIALIPPSIYDATDGGLGYDDIARDPDRLVVVKTGPWGDIKTGDVVEILYGPDLEVVGSHRYTVVDNLQPHVQVRASLLAQHGEGTMLLAARITLVDTGEAYQTAEAEVAVKLSVPGGLDPNPETPNRNESLDAPVILPSPLPDDLSDIFVEVPPYRNMAVGDRVTVQWHTTSLRHGPLTLDEVDRPIRVGVTKEVAAGTNGKDVAVRYQVHDRVANRSLWSPEAIVDVPPGGDAPPAPWVDGTVRDEGKVVDLATLGDRDLHVRVEGHPAQAGDDIVVSWTGVTAAGKAVDFTCPPIRVQRPNQALDTIIPHDKVASLSAGRASAGYSIMSGGTKVATSRRRHLAIEGVPRQLMAPSVREALDGTLDPAAVDDGAHVVVDAWDGIDGDDRCYLEWVGTREDGQATFFHAGLSGSDVNPDKTLVFTVPTNEVSRIAGGTLRVRYAVAIQAPIVYRDGIRKEPLVHLESPWLDLNIARSTAPLSIDSTPATLSGKITRLEKRVTVPPEDTFMARVATGGVPPYRYTANSGAVEVDEATGRVASLRNGVAVITVTDARGATASYEVTVSNVTHLVDLDRQGGWDVAVRLAGEHKASIPSLDDWDTMRAAYGGFPSVRADAAWSSVAVDKFFRYAVFPNTGAREPRRYFGLGSPLQGAWVWIVTVPTA
ncbi:hypothetical protein [Luteibacter aegosomatissinici]|uniref:hypothetical protein n=1 Tax=Luteibacter aegosomatissinici TaxID=2911539 RepID=UPI001FF72EDD|nr:hypothetical protein [Luteibacter aegosomatissinici]UPG96417.1 hypothetical protein L2Y97_09990 [Luteibacter aegosomatissinici]